MLKKINNKIIFKEKNDTNKILDVIESFKIKSN